MGIVVLNTNVTMFRCQFCEFGSVHFRLLSQHYNEKHEYLPHFSVECVIEGCITRFHSVKGLKNHIKRKHPDFYRANVTARTVADPPQNLQDIGNDSDDQVEIDNGNQNDPDLQPGEDRRPSIKDQVANSLLSLREKHKLPANSTSN